MRSRSGSPTTVGHKVATDLVGDVECNSRTMGLGAATGGKRRARTADGPTKRRGLPEGLTGRLLTLACQSRSALALFMVLSTYAVSTHSIWQASGGDGIELSITRTSSTTSTTSSRRAGGRTDDLPTQVHIALGGMLDESGSLSGVSLMWQTEECFSNMSYVEFWEEPEDGEQSEGEEPNLVAGSCSSYYSTADHLVTLEGLRLGGHYLYRVGSPGMWSSKFSFQMPGGDLEETKVAFIADLDVMSSSGRRTVNTLGRMAESSELSAVIHGGDIAYADNAFLHHNPLAFRYERVWNDFLMAIEPVASRVPYMTAAGNHEAECHSPACLSSSKKLKKLSNYVAYNSRFNMPSKASGGAKNMWYSFNLGLIHFVVISTETDYPGYPNNKYSLWDGSLGGFGDQLAWLRTDLEVAQQERAKRPFIVVVGHRPIYSIKTTGSDGKAFDRLGINPVASKSTTAAFEPLFHEFGVDLYLGGHTHAYERSWPVLEGAATAFDYKDPSGTTYIIAGAAGNLEGIDKYSNIDGREWNAKLDTTNHGFGIITALSPTELKWTYVNSADGTTVLDEFTITKTNLYPSAVE